MRAPSVELLLELIHPDAWLDRTLPALEAAGSGGSSAALAAIAGERLPGLVRDARELEAALRRSLGAGAAGAPEVIAAKLAVARLEALVATAPEPLATEAAREEVAWALLRASRVAPPVWLGQDWDLLRALLDPARRRPLAGLGGLATTLAGAALVGEVPFAAANGFALARGSSYATGWNSPARVARVARSLSRWDRARLERSLRALSADVRAGLYPAPRGSLARRGTREDRVLERAVAALETLREGYETARERGAGVFVELHLG